MTARHRVGAFDQTLQHIVDFGLGVICNSNVWGVDTVPYGFGRWSSSGAFGHGVRSVLWRCVIRSVG
ncbi:MAG UNVERIFIED_CONTAM: hypothetical protein LVR18_24495 [Planctomycetaceae bacterium]|jgi:hypothetical protein